MHTPSWRRIGALTLLVVFLSLVLVPAAAAAPAQSAANAPVASGCAPVYYRVRYGDNLTVIAWRYGVTVWQLQQWNRISNANRIYAGQTLVIYPCGMPAPLPPPPPPPPPPCWCYNCGCAPMPPPPHLPPPPMGPAWQAEYFSNVDLVGPPAFSRQDRDINFNWSGGSPVDGCGATHFSVRWSRVFWQDRGVYRVSVAADDGVRVYIDGVLIIDGWSVHPVTNYTQDVMLYTGNHTWTVEYFQAEGEAVIQVTSRKIR